MNRRRILVVLVDRANYGRLKPVMRAIAERPSLELLVLCAGTMVLERFLRPSDLVRQDGFAVDGEVFLELEGSTPLTMAKSLGFGIIEFAAEFRRLEPDVVLVIGDRYEALAATLAAAYMNLCVAHIQGGEVSGSIDESARHAISKFAHYHFPSTRRSADFLARMGEHRDTILAVGCPSSDLAKTVDGPPSGEALNSRGSGAQIDPTQPFLLAVFHPTTTSFGDERRQAWALLEALSAVKRQTLLLWPNIDAGSDHISKAIRVFRDSAAARDWLRLLTNLPPETYLRVLAAAACAVGNSSSFVRDASFFGTPVVLVGARQDGRERGPHVVRVEDDAKAIEAALRRQLERGRYPPSDMYGDGQVAGRIADSLEKLTPYTQKRLAFPEVEVTP